VHRLAEGNGKLKRLVVDVGIQYWRACGVKPEALEQMLEAVSKCAKPLAATLYLTPQGGLVLVDCDHPWLQAALQLPEGAAGLHHRHLARPPGTGLHQGGAGRVPIDPELSALGLDLELDWADTDARIMLR
jgi:hypothetical protein